MMNNARRFVGGKVKNAAALSRIPALFRYGLLALGLVAACAPLAAPPPPPIPTYPTRVITEDGMAYAVSGFKLPGTRQELTLRVDDARQWIPLDQIQSVRFSGPVRHNYRQAEIVLLGGERFQAKVYVHILVEGTTDIGYWNMSLSKIARLDLGSD